MINSVWLTVNRACNFRCDWCYAKDTKYAKTDDMPFDLAVQLTDFSKSMGAKNVILIGGEPTYYPHLLELIKYISGHGMRVILSTNGYRFKDMNFVKEIEHSGLATIGVSIKAANMGQQKNLTKVDVFEDIKRAIKNLSIMKNTKVLYATTISQDTIDNLEEFAQMIADLDPTKLLTYSTCRPVFNEDGGVDNMCVPLQQDIVNAFVGKFDKINKILCGKFTIEMALPYCVWPKDFIKMLKETKHISFGCHVQNRRGLIFNKEGKILVCNSLPGFPIGQYGIDFTTKEEFEKFWMSDELVKLHDKFYEYPSTKCQGCDDYIECAGGCPLKWFAYNAKEIPGK